MRQKKIPPKKNMVSFCVCVLFIYPWSCIVVDVCSNTLLEKTDFPLFSSHQLQRASWLSLSLCVHSHVSVLGSCLV